MARTSFSGPVSGCYIPIEMYHRGPLVNGNYRGDYKIPDGMSARLVAVTLRTNNVVLGGGTITIDAGPINDTDGFVEAYAVTADVGIDIPLNGALIPTVGNAELPDSSTLRLNIAVAGGASADHITLCAWLFVEQHADNTVAR